MDEEDFDYYEHLFDIFLSDPEDGRVFFGDIDPTTVETDGDA